jgi:hypothetical protein
LADWRRFPNREDFLSAQRRERAFLVRADQPRVAGDIGGEDRRQPPLHPRVAHRTAPRNSAIILPFLCAIL